MAKFLAVLTVTDSRGSRTANVGFATAARRPSLQEIRFVERHCVFVTGAQSAVIINLIELGKR